jgi:hypothetical protein
LKYYRDKKYMSSFSLNNYVVALSDSNGAILKIYKELAQNDFMSTLAITTGTVKAGSYSLIV